MSNPRNGSGRGSKRSALAGRTGVEWAIRGVLAISALALAYASTANTLANVIVKIDADRAYSLAPGNGRIIAAFADWKFTAAPASDRSSEPGLLALRALRQDPTAVEALNVLGLQAQLRSEETLADRVFGYSVNLSRRELRPQIWAIEKDVARGDIEQALNNYDVALRTSRKAREMFFPVLGSAIAEPKVRSALINILTTDPVWGPAFIRYVATGGPDPQAVEQFFRAGTVRKLPIADFDRARVVSRLAAQNLMDEAWAYYGTFRPGSERDRSRDPGFDLDADIRAPFDWNIGNITGLSAAILREGDNSLLDFAISPGTRASVVRQMQLLPPGSYRLEGRSSGIDQPARSQPYWSLACQSGRELGRVEMPNSEKSNGSFSGQFTVPSACPVQILSLVARASDKISGVSGQIEYVQLAPAER